MYAKAFFGRVGSFMPMVHFSALGFTMGYFLEHDHLQHIYAHGEDGGQPGYKDLFGDSSKCAKGGH
eukprot:gene22893-1688_t